MLQVFCKSLQGVVFQGEVGTALVIKADESQTWCWGLLLICAASVCRLLEKKRSHPNFVSGDRLWRRLAQFLREWIPAQQQVPDPQEHRGWAERAHVRLGNGVGVKRGEKGLCIRLLFSVSSSKPPVFRAGSRASESGAEGPAVSALHLLMPRSISHLQIQYCWSPGSLVAWVEGVPPAASAGLSLGCL